MRVASMHTQRSNPPHGRQKPSNYLFAAILVTVLAGCVNTAPKTSSVVTPQVSGDQGVVNTAQAEDVMDRISDQTEDPVAFGELFSIIGSLSGAPLFKDNRTDLLVDGPATYKAMYEAIDGAQHFIHLETYIFADDEVGVELAAKLIERQRNGVTVRVIFDSIGSAESSTDFFDGMRKAGIELVEFNKLNPIEGGNPLNANVRDHRKLLVVDGEVAFTGGINFSSTYSSSSGNAPVYDRLKEGWRDTHIAIRGPAVAGFEEIFEANWIAQEGATAGFPPTLPEPSRVGQDVIAVLH
ncbi:MAG TPA: phospholipase D-like domain-containing protein, partial [Xanthomonadales bacterium]|nr:phospholipase D-like domain-containing protein [Xanthomonadales bacterium]